MKKTNRTLLKNSDTKESNANIALVLSILVVVPFVIYWQTTGFDLVWDDVAINLTKKSIS